MIIRLAEKGDLPQILDLYRVLFSEEDFQDLPGLEKKWEEILQFDGVRYLVLETEGQIAASCNISIVPNLSRGMRSYALIENVITHPEFRKRGYGRAVIQRAVDMARQENCYKVMLLSNNTEERKASHLFYAKIGFDRDSKKGFCIKF